MASRRLRFLLALTIFAIQIEESRQACEIQVKATPTFSGGYKISSVYDTSSQPDWPIVNHADGRIEIQVDMFQLRSGNLPFIDLFPSFAEFISASDTEATCTSIDCGYYFYYDSTDTCASTDLSPDNIYLYNGGANFYNYFDGGTSRYKYRSGDMFQYNENLDISNLDWDNCVYCTSSTSSLIIKNVHWAIYGSCETKLPAIDHTLTSSNSYSSISQTAQVFNIQGFEVYDSTNCPMTVHEVNFVDYTNLAAVPGLTETSKEVCTDRVSNTNCDGSSDLYLNWAFTQSYAALRIKLRSSFLNVHGTTISFDSQIISLKIELCETATVSSSLASSYALQIGETFTQISVNAVSSNTDCVLNSASYVLSTTSLSAVTLSSSGVFDIVDTTAALSTTTLTFSVTLGIRTVTSPSFTVEIFDCIALTSITDFKAIYQVQYGDTLTIDFPAVTTRTACVVDSSSYLVTSAKTGMSILINGTYSAVAQTVYTANTATNVSQVDVQDQFTVNVGTQTFTSSLFTIEVHNCLPDVTFPNLGSVYTAIQTQQFPTIDAIATTNSTFCLQNNKTYSLTTENGLAVEGVSISANGIISVDTSLVIPNTSLAIQMTDGFQIYDSSIFYIEVTKPVFVPEVIYAYLAENITNEQYEVQIAQNNTLELGEYIENGTTVDSLKVYLFIGEVEYGIYQKESINQKMDIDIFVVDTIYENGKVSLKIDLTQVSPLYDGSVVMGNLSFVTNFVDGPIYQDVSFVLRYTPPEEIIPVYEDTQALETEDQEEEKYVEDGRKNCSAEIYHISAQGEVQVRFNESLDLFRMKSLNQSMMDVYIEPAEDSPVELAQLNFTWNFTEIQSQWLIIQLKFGHPSKISLIEIQDTLVLHFRPNATSSLYSESIHKDTIHPLYTTLRQKIRKQLPYTNLEGVAMAWMVILKVFLVLTFVMSYLLNGSGRCFMRLILALQVIIHLPILKITVPPNVSMVFSYLIRVVQFDILDTEWTTELVFSFDNDQQIELSNQMPRGMDQWLDLGYKTHNSLLNLGTLGIFTSLYLMRLVFFLGLVVCYRVYFKNAKGLPPNEEAEGGDNESEEKDDEDKKSRRCKRFFVSMKKQLIFGEIITILILAYFEYLIAGYLQMGWPLDTRNGENFGTVFAIFGLILVYLAMPAAFLYMLTRDKEEVAEVKFQERWGKLYNGLRTRSKWHYSYFLFFTIRRIIYVTLAVGISYELNSFQVMFMIYLNMIISIYQGHCRPFEVPLINKLEYFYEFCIWCCTVLMMGYTDWVLDHQTRLDIGGAMITIVAIMNLVGLITVFYFGINAGILIYTKYRQRFDIWWPYFKYKYLNQWCPNLSCLSKKSDEFSSPKTNDLIESRIEQTEKDEVKLIEETNELVKPKVKTITKIEELIKDSKKPLNATQAITVVAEDLAEMDISMQSLNEPEAEQLDQNHISPYILQSTMYTKINIQTPINADKTQRQDQDKSFKAFNFDPNDFSNSNPNNNNFTQIERDNAIQISNEGSLSSIEMRQIFALYDKTKSGQVPTRELRTIFKAFQLDPSEVEVIAMQQKMDPNGTGYFTFESLEMVLWEYRTNRESFTQKGKTLVDDHKYTRNKHVNTETQKDYDYKFNWNKKTLTNKKVPGWLRKAEQQVLSEEQSNYNLQIEHMSSGTQKYPQDAQYQKDLIQSQIRIEDQNQENMIQENQGGKKSSGNGGRFYGTGKWKYNFERNRDFKD